MFKLHLIQARFGDCLILEFGIPSRPKFILVDGGPSTIYEQHLKNKLLNIRNSGGELELVVATHIDTDHIIGILDLTSNLRDQRGRNEKETIAIKELWLNSFTNTVDHKNEIQTRINALLATAGSLGNQMNATRGTLKGVNEGNQLRMAAITLQIPLNAGIAQDLISVETVSNRIKFDNLSLTVIGPTKKALSSLRRDWLKWLNAHEDLVADGDPQLASKADNSKPNLSSIMFLVEAEGHRMLLTGDGLGSHIIDGLEETGHLKKESRMHVNLLKLPHHGSARNVTKEFFLRIMADKYVISADGKHGNPDLATLKWIVDAAREQNRTIEIISTNSTASLEKLRFDYPENESPYSICVPPEDSSSFPIDLHV